MTDGKVNPNDPFYRAVRKLMRNSDFLVFLGYLQSMSGMFDPQTDAGKIAVQQFMIGLMGRMDLYTTRGNFQNDFNLALEGLTRSEFREKVKHG